jgi:hypothetical protein
VLVVIVHSVRLATDVIVSSDLQQVLLVYLLPGLCRFFLLLLEAEKNPSISVGKNQPIEFRNHRTNCYKQKFTERSHEQIITFKT